MGDASLQDSVVADGLTDAFHGYHMGMTGELSLIGLCSFLVDNHLIVVHQLRMLQSSGESVERTRICLLSNRRIEQRQHRKLVILTKRSFRSRWRPDKASNERLTKASFNQIWHLRAKKNLSHSGLVEVKIDEFPRHGSNIGTMSKLRPCFIKDSSGTVTAGNASGLSASFCESDSPQKEMLSLFLNLRCQWWGSSSCPHEPIRGWETWLENSGQNRVFSSSWPWPGRHGNRTHTGHQKGGGNSDSDKI